MSGNVERRKTELSPQYTNICSDRFKELQKANNKTFKKYGKKLKKMKYQIFNGWTFEVKRISKQNKFIMSMLSGIFLLLIGAVITIVLTG